jgi:hypothetical protein
MSSIITIFQLPVRQYDEKEHKTRLGAISLQDTVVNIVTKRRI